MNPKHERRNKFIREYLVDQNGTQAAIRAGYAPNSANEQASRLLANDSVRKEIEEGLSKLRKKTNVTAERVIKELARIAFADLSQAYDENGNLLPPHKLPVSIRRAMTSVEVFDEFVKIGNQREKIGETKKVRFADKVKALEILAKHFNLFTDRLDLTSKGEKVESQVHLYLPKNGRTKEENEPDDAD